MKLIFGIVHRKAEIESKRKLEEVERKRQEDADRKAALDLQAQIEREDQEDSRFRQQLEQERRDHELALRLAQESNGQVEDSPPLIRKYVFDQSIFQTRLFPLYKIYRWVGSFSVNSILLRLISLPKAHEWNKAQPSISFIKPYSNPM